LGEHVERSGLSHGSQEGGGERERERERERGARDNILFKGMPPMTYFN
jgi:hypothetical protein